MQLKQATRKRARMRLGLQGPSGSGKTLGALQIAYGLCNDFSRIAVIDSEHGSASLYSHIGLFNTIELTAPFTPEKFIDAIHLCENSNMEAIIIDSLSHAWDGPGGILDIHGSMAGNSFTNWNKVTPRYNELVQAILQSPCHVITTIRSKQDYILVDKGGKMVPEKVGLKGIQREGFDYELTVHFEIDIKHNVTVTKDRTSLFTGKPEFRITPEIGERLLAWCLEGEPPIHQEDVVHMIMNSPNIDALLSLYKLYPEYQVILHDQFTTRRKQLQMKATETNIYQQQNPI